MMKGIWSRAYLPYCAPMLKTEAGKVVGVTTISRLSRWC